MCTLLLIEFLVKPKKGVRNSMNEELKNPNIIWIFGDQHRGQAIGYMGDPNLHTPNIDRLAIEGVVFNSAVSGSPLCCPFRGSMITSLYPHKCVPGHEFQLPSDKKTIADVFNEHGYRTSYFGKWHLAGYKESEGRNALKVIPSKNRGGFRDWCAYDNNNSQWDSWVHGGEGENSFLKKLEGYETDALTDIFIDYLKNRAKEKREGIREPFFSVLSVQPPHDPYLAPSEWMQRHTPGEIRLRENVPKVKYVEERARRELAGYYAMIENLDWNIGRIIKTLEEEDLLWDTYIIFLSDHGDMLGSHGQFRKTSPWEEATRIPFLISGGRPLYYYKTGETNTLINHVDIAPTTLGLCGIEAPSWMEGIDYSGYRLVGKDINHEADSAYLQISVATHHEDSIDRPWRGIVTKDGWKYCVLEGQPWLMYNLNEDPYEQVNLAFNTKYRVERKKLNERLKQWIIDTDDDFLAPEFLF